MASPLATRAHEQERLRRRVLVDVVASLVEQEELHGEAADEVEPFSDLHASAGYRRHLTRVLVRDALDEAHARARAEE